MLDIVGIETHKVTTNAASRIESSAPTVERPVAAHHALTFTYVVRRRSVDTGHPHIKYSPVGFMSSVGPTSVPNGPPQTDRGVQELSSCGIAFKPAPSPSMPRIAGPEVHNEGVS